MYRVLPKKQYLLFVIALLAMNITISLIFYCRMRFEPGVMSLLFMGFIVLLGLVSAFVLGRVFVQGFDAANAYLNEKDFSENMFMAMQDGFSIVDPEGVHVDVNPAMSQMTGFSQEELIGQGLPHPYWPPEEMDKINAAFEKTQQGAFDSFELVFKRKNGERFPVLVCPSAIKNPAGEVVYYFASIREITKHKRIELMLRHAERLAKIGSWELSLETNQLTWSEEVYRIHEVDDSFEPTLETAISFYTEEARTLIENAIERCMSEMTPWDLELQVKTANEQLIWVRAQGEGEFVDGKCVRLRGIFQDINHRKLNELALNESQEQIRSMFDATNVGMAIVNADGEFSSVNDATCQLLGYDMEEMLQKTFLEVTHPDDMDKSKLHFKSVLASRRPYTLEKRYLTKTGGLLWGLTSVSPIFHADGSLNYVIAHLQNITDLKEAEARKNQLEQQLQRSQKMETIGTLAGGIAHDFNNLLTPIMGYTEIVLDGQPEDSAFRDDLNNVMQFTLRAKELVEQILLFGKQVEKERHPIDLKLIIDEALKLVQQARRSIFILK